MSDEQYSKSLPITSWAESDRPREKLMALGRTALTDAELVAILLGSGNTKASAVELAKQILNAADNNLNVLGKWDLSNLKSFKGIGDAKGISILAALELGRRRGHHEVSEKKKITGSKDVYTYLYSFLADKPHEEFWMVLLNRANRIIGKHQISHGGISGTVADVRLIFKKAIVESCSSIILCHNHPSGNLKPSSQDIILTKKIVEAGKLLDISILDHIIIGDEAYFSFADEGMIS